MKTKFKSIFVISIMLLSALIVNWNLNAINLDDKMNHTSRSNKPPRAGNFDWGEIEVISEPIPGLNNNINDSYNPKIAIENDKIYLVWEDKTDYNSCGGDSDIFFRNYDGSNWSDIQVISEPSLGGNSNNGSSYYPNIAVENGNVYVVWHDSTNIIGAGEDYDILFRCNLASRPGWEGIQIISEPTLFGNNDNKNHSYLPALAVENGNIFIVWQDKCDWDNSGTDYDIFYRCNLTTRSGWEAIQNISDPYPGNYPNTNNSANPKIAVENGNIYVVWPDPSNWSIAGTDHDIFYRHNLTGDGNWNEIEIISEPKLNENQNDMSSFNPAIGVEKGNIYVVWMDNTNLSGASDEVFADYDIFYRCKLVYGFGWENIQVISEPVFGSNNNPSESSYPEIVIENSKIFIVWQDRNNTNGAGIDPDIFFRCNLTGTTWEDIQVISESVAENDFNIGNSMRPDIITNPGKIYIVWHDQNDTNNASTDWDIFYRSVLLSPVLDLPNVLPLSGNTNTNFNFTVKYYHLFNKIPIKIIVNISGKEHPMLEIDQADTNYTNGKNYFFNIKNIDIGFHTYQFYAFDGINTVFTRLFNKLIVNNTLPNISTEDNFTAVEDIYYEVRYEYEDIDITNVGQPGYWNFSTNAKWLNFNYTTAILNGTPKNDDVGEYWVNISINDIMDSDFTNFTLTVVNVNDAPVIITDDIKAINEDEYYENYYIASDVDSPQNSLFWNMQTNASWLDFKHTTAKLSGIPENNDIGESWVNISISDDEYNDYSNFTLRVINVNDPPQIITKDNTTAYEDELYEMIYKAEDIDNIQSDLTWTINTNAKWLNYDISTAIINGTPTNNDIGEYWVNISVSDNEFIDFANFTLAVINTNDPPSIITEDKTNITIDEMYSVNYEADDIDPPPITFTWFIKTNTSDWLSIDPITGWVTGLPSVDYIGIYWVNISVTDSDDGWDSHNFTLRVLKLPIQKNNPPKLSNITLTPSAGNIDTSFTFSIHYFDADNDAPVSIQVVIDDIPRNLKLRPGGNVSNGIYYYNTTLSEEKHTYYFITSDGLEKISTDNYTTPEIRKLKEISKEKTSWYWLIWIIIFIIIITLILSGYAYNKRKAVKIPVIKAELMKAVPKHLAIPGEISSGEIAESLLIQPKILVQLPPPKVQIQPTNTAQGDKTYTSPSTIPTPVQPQYQLPQATLTKAQKLGLLQERFLRGEETYNKLKSDIEGSPDADITATEEELKGQNNIGDQQETNPIEEATKIWVSPIKTPEPVGKPPLESVIEPQFKAQQLQPEQQETTATQTEQTPQKLSSNVEVDAQNQQTAQSQSLTQTHQQLKSIEKGKIDEE